MKPATHRSDRVLRERVVVDRWPKGNGREFIGISIKGLTDANIITIEVYVPGSRLEPGRNFSITVDHIPRLARAITKAEQIARERGLIGGDR